MCIYIYICIYILVCVCVSRASSLSGSRFRLYTRVPLTRRGGPICTDRNGSARQDGGGTLGVGAGCIHASLSRSPEGEGRFVQTETAALVRMAAAPRRRVEKHCFAINAVLQYVKYIYVELYAK